MRCSESSGTKRGRPPLAPCWTQTYSSACRCSMGRPVAADSTTQPWGLSITASLRRNPTVRMSRSDAPTEGSLTLPPKNVSLAERFNASKENGNDEDSAGALHAGIQAGGSATGSRRPEHRSGGQDAGRGGADAVQLGQGGSPEQAHRR